MCVGRKTNHLFFQVCIQIHIRYQPDILNQVTFRRKPFFQRYPALTTLSSSVCGVSTDRHLAPPAVPSSSSSSPSLSSIAVNWDGCPADVTDGWKKEVDASGESWFWLYASESDSVPECGILMVAFS
jgi:hypothetical protein